ARRPGLTQRLAGGSRRHGPVGWAAAGGALAILARSVAGLGGERRRSNAALGAVARGQGATKGGRRGARGGRGAGGGPQRRGGGGGCWRRCSRGSTRKRRCTILDCRWSSG